MQIMRMSYNDLSEDGKQTLLHVYGVGDFPVFSGQDPHKNDPNCTFLSNSAIPVGRYYIVPRPDGSYANRVRGWAIDAWTGNNHSEWFGLYSAKTMTDSTYIGHSLRGGFRLHPLRPDGSGFSEGCITFVNRQDFYTVRKALLKQGMKDVPGSRHGLQSYGWVDVQGVSNFAECKQ
ncbi:DUF2778 domain-containing protein [Candidatus Pantoea multigeneris]|uniref:DUF2778 domain-containing protein n=1 Tax=Candidatus Pantoea multigeneris TaxID=2608357 RepID=A0ABX0RCI9_9GAMM|nr:DUF2778 domain-containing protein [Pantoea multigeneris]NIF23070.1 DUF2778 domain-containing protein [Pantoea multigeneris]